ncbi:MAG TPA: hypothetical protein VGX78_02700 [Pirellulales bacterium]|nr:hypothetical protein [Pirellulales bacterium]
MKIQQFLDHHGVASNPFAEEDAQTDPVFKEHCIHSTYHPTWDKVYGDPAEPATSIVFGEKGSGKTALRLQIVRHLTDFNTKHPNQRVFVIEYDDFNPFLDRFRDKLPIRRRRLDQVFSQWKLWDHMDAILSLGVTRLVDRILDAPHTPGPRPSDVGLLETALLDRQQARDLLLLAACYDQSSAETFRQRWHRLRRKLRFSTWRTKWPLALGAASVTGVFGLIAGLAMSDWAKWDWLAQPWPYLIAAAGWLPWLAKAWKWYWRAHGVTRQLRVVNHEANPLRQVLMEFRADEISSQPLPNKERTDDRFELLVKLQGVLRTLGFAGVVVLVDRVDEPHLVNGSPEQMRALLWPMLDNKFLKHPGIGFKLLLPIELSYFIDREDRDFYQRARLDKQNLVPSLQWTGEALYDIANARLRACAANGQAPSLAALFEESVNDRRLIAALRTLRVPRHMFKFLHRLFVAHANAHTDDRPAWKISGETFESVLTLYQRDQEAYDRGLGVA